MSDSPKRAHRPKQSTKATANHKISWTKYGIFIGLVAILLPLLLFALVWMGIFGKVPSAVELQKINTPVASEVLSSDGRILGRYYVQNRSNVAFNEISPAILNALVATEDARFYEHRGIDEVALLRVFFKSVLLRDRSSGGGSTISQQIAKNLYPRSGRGWVSLPANKIREAIIAYRLEKIYAKDEILTLYLNSVPFGENIFGIDVAAERFFSKTPAEINVPEAAVLVGILKANTLFNPRLYPDQSLQRRNTVIDRMARYNYITLEEGDKFKSMPLGLNYSLITYNQGPAPYLLEHIRPMLLEALSGQNKPGGEPYNLFTDGLKIYTTIDFTMQRYATQAMTEHMEQLQKVFNTHWQGRDPWGSNQSVVDRAMRRTDRYRSQKAAGLSDEQIRLSFDQPIDATLFSWEGLASVHTTPLDSLKHYIKMLNAGFLALEANSGHIKAWVGGIDFRYFKFDYLKAPRQVGSTFKPIVYLAALEQDLSPLDYYPNERKVYQDFQDWSPSNSDDHYEGYYSMQTALAKSVNTVAVDLIMQAGIDKTIQVAKSLGITADLPRYPSLALGSASISLQEMIIAYASLLNGGVLVKPAVLLRIENSDGEILKQFEVETSMAGSIDPENSRLVVDMLRGAVDAGTGRAIRTTYNVDGDFAGKTGTTQDHADGWFIGFTPTIVAGSWVGADDPAVHFRTIAYGQGGYMALPIVGKFFNKLYSDSKFAYLRVQRFDPPDRQLTDQMAAMEPWVERLRPAFDLREIFRRKETLGDDDAPGVRDRQPAAETDREPVWEKIRRIFRKRD